MVSGAARRYSCCSGQVCRHGTAQRQRASASRVSELLQTHAAAGIAAGAAAAGTKSGSRTSGRRGFNGAVCVAASPGDRGPGEGNEGQMAAIKALRRAGLSLDGGCLARGGVRAVGPGARDACQGRPLGRHGAATHGSVGRGGQRLRGNGRFTGEASGRCPNRSCYASVGSRWQDIGAFGPTFHGRRLGSCKLEAWEELQGKPLTQLPCFRTPQRDASTPPAVHEVPAEQLHSFCALSVLNVQLRGQRVVLKSPRATRLSVSWTRRPMACPCPATPCPLQRRQLPLPCDTPSPLPGVSAPGHLRLLRTLSLGHRRPSVDGYAAASRQAAVATPRGYSAYRYSEALVSPRAVVTPRISNNSGGQQSSFSSHPNPPPQLPPELQLHVLSFLPPNDLALSGRAACREAWVSFDQPEHRAARLSQPLPTHAVQPFLEYGSVYGMRLLPFRRKLQLLSTAAASGCEANLEVAWGLLRLCVPPELLLPPPGAGDGAGAASILDRYGSVLPDPGVEAVRHGHVHLLRWLLQHRCPLQPSATLEAAAAHCDLAGMQAAWQLLQGNAGDGQRLELGPGVLAAAVGSATPKWQAKADWVLQQAQQRASPLLGVLAAVAAARTGDLSRLRWLLAHGCPMGSWEVLEAALQHADLCITRWLVEQAGCCRVPDQEDEEAWGYLTAAAAASPIDPVPKLQWLHHRGLASLLLHDAGGSAELLQSAAVAAAQAGQLQSLQWLHEVCRYRYRYGGAEQLLTGEVFRAAAGPGNIPTAAWLLRHGCPADPGAYKAAACRGDLAMLTWLAREARCHVHPGAAPAIILAWPQGPAWGTRRPSARPGPALDQMAAPGVGGGAGDLLRALCVLEEAADAADEAAAPGGGPIAKDSMSSSGSSSRCLDAAALRGDVELVRYLLQQQGKRAGAGGGGAGAAGSRGCPRRPPARTVRLAAEGGCVAVVELLAREVGFEEDVWGWGDSYDKAVRRGDRAMVECLRGLGI